MVSWIFRILSSVFRISVRCITRMSLLIYSDTRFSVRVKINPDKYAGIIRMKNKPNNFYNAGYCVRSYIQSEVSWVTGRLHKMNNLLLQKNKVLGTQDYTPASPNPGLLWFGLLRLFKTNCCGHFRYLLHYSHSYKFQ